jgi:hypothetical protein
VLLILHSGLDLSGNSGKQKTHLADI